MLVTFPNVPVFNIFKAAQTHYQCRVVKVCCCGESQTSHRTCYRHQSYQAASLVAKALDLSTDRWSVAFQSRLGKEEWLQPYTSTVLHDLPSREIKDICVVAPSFIADCIESLGELGIEGKEIFISSGGDNYITAECINSSESLVDFLSNKFNIWFKIAY